MSGTSTILEQSLCVGLVIIFLIWFYRGKAEKKRAKEEWRATCKVDWLTILDRYGHPGGTSEDGYGDTHSYRASYSVDLEMNADQRVVAPNEETVHVKVSESLYEKLINRSTVCIYYQPDAPLAFFISEEFNDH